jgi:dephospho-CoA kinase
MWSFGPAPSAFRTGIGEPAPIQQNQEVNHDERVLLTKWRADWLVDYADLATRLGAALASLAVRIDHIGSTSVPELPAKDVIDLQVIVGQLDRELIMRTLGEAGFEQRVGDWNFRDHIPAGWSGDPELWQKLVFGPPRDVRPCNVHVRVLGQPNERYALLFRDFLRADDAARVAWGRFKVELARTTKNLSDYGAVKDPATDLLMAAAERWATDVAWTHPAI